MKVSGDMSHMTCFQSKEQIKKRVNSNKQFATELKWEAAYDNFFRTKDLHLDTQKKMLI